MNKAYITKVKLYKSIALLFMITIMAVPTMVYASEDESSQYTSEIQQFITNNCPQSSAYINDTSVQNKWDSVSSGYIEEVSSVDGSAGADYNKCTVGSVTYQWKASNEQIIVNKIKTSENANFQTYSDIDDISEKLNLHADTSEAINLTSGISPIVNLILGIACVIIILLLGLYTGSDIMYLAFPVFRNKVEDDMQSGKTGFNVKKDSNGESKHRFISDDAVRAYKQSISEGGGKQPYVKYFTSRLLAYVLIAFLLTVLLTGNIGIFIKFGVRIGEGFTSFIERFTS